MSMLYLFLLVLEMEMKTFKLDKKAYHSLENRFEINISESGHIVSTNDSRIAYHIKLDEKREVWVYCKYTKKRDKYRDFIKTNKYSRCFVLAAFDQASKFNR